jgi:hypothetical protein
MSKQKKKKPSNEAQMKMLEAKSRKEFKQNLLRVCTLLGDGSVCSMFTGELFERMFNRRGIAPKVKAEEGYDIPVDIPVVVKKALNSLMKTINKPIKEGGPEMSAIDFCVTLLPMQLFWSIDRHIEQYKDRPELPRLLKILPGMDVIYSMLPKFMNDIAFHSDVYIFLYQCFTEGSYTGRADLLSDDRTGSLIQIIVKVSFHPPEWRTFGSGDKQRLAIRMACSRGGRLVKIDIESQLLGLRGNNPIPVYIMQHAIKRLNERISCKYPQASEFEMMLAFIVPKITRQGKSHYLVEFRTSNLKAGYFLCELVENALLVRTFLFLTHDGTPEGKMLTETTGLGKLDQKYLRFDNLLTLANSDILSNEEAMDIFRKAGCGELLELCPVIRQMASMWDISDKEIPLAEKLLYYLKVNREENWLDTLRAENSGTLSLPDDFEFPAEISDEPAEQEE